ncbi:ferrous iron transport protein B [Dethiosulfatarculus sandiegensis]|uniref:Ferrous iron transport protein B n=1 Tax=Dethiosulfatarculus sandiegensis TaxID=1429043 RepID=A0A0D2HWI1_9BACT|nr:ferrous iron transport protein B [Dethiosulfatarculus sandiegensis]KIX14733.1 iron transporter FeoB [Dethiosulfatarculus sandiegensis]
MSEHGLTFALAGNPNSGKTSLFNAITGARQHVGNFPGVTVESKEGTVKVEQDTVRVVDLPGSYSLTAYTLEEVVARNYLIDHRPDVVIDVVDASNLERNLYLTIQLLELGAPVVIALNMFDAAEKNGMRINVEELSRLLGVPIVPTVARTGQGVEDLLRAARDRGLDKSQWIARRFEYGSDVEKAIKGIQESLGGLARSWLPLTPRWVAMKCLEDDEEVIKKLKTLGDGVQKVLQVTAKAQDKIRKLMDDEAENVIADFRYGHINGIFRSTVRQRKRPRLDMSDKVDRVLTNSFVGPAFMLAVLYLTYQMVFHLSGAPVSWLEALFGYLGDGVSWLVPEGLLRSLLVSGIIDGVGGVMSFVPLILFMFLAIALMEDSGYLARVAYMLDRVLRMFGLHGNSVIAFIVGGGISGGCAVPGVMATRTLKDPKARLATILTVPFMVCGAKLPVFTMLTAAFFAKHQAEMMFGLTIIGWIFALGAAKILRMTILKGEQAPFVMEMPPYRLPTLRSLVLHTWERTWQYLRKAGTVILGISIVMWALMTFPGLPADQVAGFENKIAKAGTQEEAAQLKADLAEARLAWSLAGRMGQGLAHLTSPLGFDWKTDVALVGGFAAKEVIISTMGTAYSMGAVDAEESQGLSAMLAASPKWSPLKAFALMIFILLYAPCLVTVAVTKRETGSWGWAVFSTTYSTILAYLAALLAYQGGLMLGLG